jgi:hypothetical protein
VIVDPVALMAAMTTSFVVWPRVTINRPPAPTLLAFRSAAAGNEQLTTSLVVVVVRFTPLGQRAGRSAAFLHALA